MSISRKAEPPNARNILYEALSRRIHYVRHIRALRGTAQVSAPLPVYRLDFKASSRPHPLRNARLKGWNYLLLGGESAGLAHLHWSRGQFTFAGITDGPAAQVLVDAANLADRLLQSLKRAFEARLLEIPSIQVHALWLYCRGGASQFVVFRTVGAGAKIESLSEFEKRIGSAVRYWTSLRRKRRQQANGDRVQVLHAEHKERKAAAPERNKVKKRKG